jgi:hypothetical protein
LLAEQVPHFAAAVLDYGFGFLSFGLFGFGLPSVLRLDGLPAQLSVPRGQPLTGKLSSGGVTAVHRCSPDSQSYYGKRDVA